MRLRYLVGLVPPGGMLGGIWWANRTEPYVLGLPFFVFWLVTWTVLASVTMAVIYWIDPANKEDRS